MRSRAQLAVLAAGILVPACSPVQAPAAAETSGGGTAATETLEPGSSSETGPPPPSDDRVVVLPDFERCDPAAAPVGPVRVASWNIGATLGSSLGAVLDVIAELDADVLLVQEIEIGAVRSGEVDLPAALAEPFGYDYAFTAALEFDGGDFGLAVFSRLPFASARRIALNSEDAYEPRIALDATVCAGRVPLRVVDVHADFLPDANRRNLDGLAAELGTLAEPSVVAGDFNATPDTDAVVEFVESTGVVDAFALRDPGPTRLGERIDFVMVTPALDGSVMAVSRVETEASDHTPLLVDLEP